MGKLLEQLSQLATSDMIPMHMPGHKRNSIVMDMPRPIDIDITEIDGYDNLHHADGIIRDISLRAAELFGADYTYLLINGSSSGIIAAICGATNKGDKVLVARNVHASVSNAIYLNELRADYIYPQLIDQDACIYGEITSQQISEAMDGQDYKAVIITSPTYEGIVSDIETIASIVDSHNSILIVDEAHGAHFNCHKAFPTSAVMLGADAVIQSIHKTLPAMTQTALLHINGNRISRDRVELYWNIMQTTSPSYVLMASIENCLDVIQYRGEELFNAYIAYLTELRDRISKLSHIRLLATDDPSKIVLIVRDAKKFYDELRLKHNIQLEMSSFNYVIAMTTVGDTKEYLDRFYEALLALDRPEYNLSSDNNNLNTEAIIQDDVIYNTSAKDKRLTIYEAVNSNSIVKELADAEGCIAVKPICIYPPGINIVNPGEVITKEIIAKISSGIELGLEVIGVDNGQIRIKG